MVKYYNYALQMYHIDILEFDKCINKPDINKIIIIYENKLNIYRPYI